MPAHDPLSDDLLPPKTQPRRHDFAAELLFVLKNLLLLPLRLLFDLAVALSIVGLAVIWWGFVFGSGVVFIIVLIFAPHLLLLPFLPAAFFLPLWPKEIHTTERSEPISKEREPP